MVESERAKSAVWKIEFYGKISCQKVGRKESNYKNISHGKTQCIALSTDGSNYLNHKYTLGDSGFLDIKVSRYCESYSFWSIWGP